jgi:hypothetical protein
MATVQKKKRSKKTLERLEAQLTSGMKPARIESDRPGKKYKTIDKTVPLNDKDKERLNKQIETLKTRI